MRKKTLLLLNMGVFYEGGGEAPALVAIRKSLKSKALSKAQNE
jgi:hypothetical protein